VTSFSSIAHSSLEICSPVPWRAYRELLLTDPISDHPEILDIGCGKGGILAKTIDLLGGKGTGLDLENSLCAEPTLTAQKLVVDGKLEFVFEDARTFLKKNGSSFDLIICVGSSHAVGSIEQLFNIAKKRLKPGGKLLFGEIVWKAQPAKEFLDFLECTEEDQMYPAQILSLAQRNGLFVHKSISCSHEDFEAYELVLRNNVIDWCKRNSKDSRAPEFARRSDTWWEAREKWARQAFGFEVVLAGPAQPQT
jgi:cyclopropane fatty-acyl-phospholipid synthase-like methyltransferase